MLKSSHLLSLALLFVWLDCCRSIETDLTVDVAAGKRECFYQFVEKGSMFDMEYQVVDGGELDINFMVQSPSGRVMITEIRKVDGSHQLEAIEGGDFKFCLDNTFSRFSSKLVFFEVTTDDRDPNWARLETLKEQQDMDDLYEMRLEDFEDVLDLVKSRLDKSQQSQKILKAIEKRDRSLVEDNFARVNFWSLLHLLVLVSVGLVQVLMVRNLFGDKSSTSGTSSKLNIRT